jgi:hypothetical protein
VASFFCIPNSSHGKTTDFKPGHGVDLQACAILVVVQQANPQRDVEATLAQRHSLQEVHIRQPFMHEIHLSK